MLMERLDYILVSESLNLLMDKVEIDPSFKSDHAIPWMVVVKNDQSRGPDYWKFNKSLLEDEQYVHKVREIIKDQLEVHRDSVGIIWKLIKMEIRGYSIQYSMCRKKETQKELDNLSLEIKLLEIR